MSERQNILVTAGGGGVGRVIAQQFHEAGENVFACDVSQEGLDSLKAACPGVHTDMCDAGDASQIAATVSHAQGALGDIDVLVNNVGIAGPTAKAEDVTLEDWETSLQVNLTSHFLFAKALIPSMKRRGQGLIVNISSGSARTGLPLRLPYVVSKYAVLGLTKNLARELGPSGIRVNAILPGPVRGDRVDRIIAEKSEALDVSPEEYEASLVRYTSLRCLMEPEDIASSISFLASPAGQRITGQLIGVDGNLEWEE